MTMTKTLPSGPPDTYAAPFQAPPFRPFQEIRSMHKYLMSFVMRAAIVSAAFVASAGVVLGVGALFHGASREPWLPDSAQARAALAECQARADRAQPGACVRRVMAEARQREQRFAQLDPAR